MRHPAWAMRHEPWVLMRLSLDIDELMAVVYRPSAVYQNVIVIIMRYEIWDNVAWAWGMSIIYEHRMQISWTGPGRSITAIIHNMSFTSIHVVVTFPVRRCTCCTMMMALIIDHCWTATTMSPVDVDAGIAYMSASPCWAMAIGCHEPWPMYHTIYNIYMRTIIHKYRYKYKHNYI